VTDYFYVCAIDMIEQDGKEREAGALCWGSELSIGFNARVEAVQENRHSGRVQVIEL